MTPEIIFESDRWIGSCEAAARSKFSKFQLATATKLGINLRLLPGWQQFLFLSSAIHLGGYTVARYSRTGSLRHILHGLIVWINHVGDNIGHRSNDLALPDIVQREIRQGDISEGIFPDLWKGE